MEDGHVYIADLTEGPLHAIYLIVESRRLTARNGKPYLALSLRDNTASIQAKRWDVADAECEWAKPGAFVEVTGEVEIYRETPQIIVRAMREPADEDIDRNAFETDPGFDPQQLLQEILELLRGIEDPDLLRLAEAYLDDAEFMARLEVSPAAKMMHHPYKHGLLEHVHSVMKLGEKLCDHYSWVDRGLVTLGLFLHDSGKVVELIGEEVPSYTTEGELLGHITIGIGMLDRKLAGLADFPLRKAVLLKHIILSHHERAEYGSPKPPMIPEAQVVHAVEMLDAKMNAFLRERSQHPESRDEVGGLRWSRLLKRRIVTAEPESTDAPD